MAEQPVLAVEARTSVGSNTARQIRRAGRIPGILYGHGTEQPISLDAHDFSTHVPPSHYGSFVVQVSLDGKSVGAALVAAVQVNTLRRQILHVDLQRVSSSDRVHVSVPVVLTGEPAAVRAGGVLEQFNHAVNLRCGAFEVPEQILYDITPLQLGDALHAGQLALPADAELLDKPDEVIALIVPPTVPVSEEAIVMQPEVSSVEVTEES